MTIFKLGLVVSSTSAAGKYFLEMLRDKRFDGGWRKLATMSRVVGADEDATKRLLLEVGARGSERDDGMWGLIENHPFDKVDQ